MVIELLKIVVSKSGHFRVHDQKSSFLWMRTALAQLPFDSYRWMVLYHFTTWSVDTAYHWNTGIHHCDQNPVTLTALPGCRWLVTIAELGRKLRIVEPQKHVDGLQVVKGMEIHGVSSFEKESDDWKPWNVPNAYSQGCELVLLWTWDHSFSFYFSFSFCLCLSLFPLSSLVWPVIPSRCVGLWYHVIVCPNPATLSWA